MSKLKKAAPVSLFGDSLSAFETETKSVKTQSATAKTSAAHHFTLASDLLNVEKYQSLETNKHIAHEFQSFGCYLAETLADKRHTSLYIKLAKTMSRSILERALSFVSDAKVDNKAKLFMWKLQQLKKELTKP